jgi:acyl-CoA synthetase (AMP-forming)/AMP-acid ligase II
MEKHSTFRDILEYRKHKNPDRDAVIFLADGEKKEERLTFSGLYREARRCAAGLQARGIRKGDRVLIMLPSGLDFLACVYGALFMGAVPVPVCPPFSWVKIDYYLLTLIGIAQNSEARMLITFARAKAFLENPLRKVRCLETLLDVSEIAEDRNRVEPSPIDADDLAMIQYNSHSTRNIRGVMYTHGNIIANLRGAGESYGISPEEEIGCSWLPMYYNFGLIGSIFFSLYWGLTFCLMSPLHFVCRPVRWLQTISRYRCTLSPAPNFAFALCAREIQQSDLADLDLSCWKMAFIGAEPVRKHTLDAFVEKFGPCGFQRKALYPVYGLPEHTMAVSISGEHKGPCYLSVERSAVETGETVKICETAEDTIEYISVGSPLPGHEIRIIDEKARVLPELTVGEIAAGGPSLSRGYCKSQEAFASHLLSCRDSSMPLFRTGDLGFLYRKNLYVTGRKKERIIIRGRTYYARDIEGIVEEHPYSRRGCSAAFSVESEEGTEALVVVAESKALRQEKRKKFETDIQSCVANALGLRVAKVALIPPRTIPRAATGEIQRRTCRKLFLEGTLPAFERLTLWQKALIPLRSAFR